MTTNNTKIELMSIIQDSNQRVTDWFMEIPADTFFTRHGEEWSVSDNLDHLIEAHKPITKALKLPKLTLQAMFGKPEKSFMAHEELCRIYRDEIAKGARASGHFLPDQENPADKAEEKKKGLPDQWSKAGAELVSMAQKRDDGELDQYQLPHPILGKLTISEMLYFTIYHNFRHASQEGD